MRIRIMADPNGAPPAEPPAGMRTLYQSGPLTVQGGPEVTAVPLADGRQAFLVGHVVGRRTHDGELAKLTFVSGALEAVLNSQPPAKCQELLEGRFMVAVVGPDGAGQVFGDRYGQCDVYYQTVDGVTYLASDLSLLPVADVEPLYDQVGLAHMLVMYGYRPAKRHTIYAGVRRLGVGDIARLQAGQMKVDPVPFQPAPAGPFGERELNEYADIFLDAVRARGSRYGNVVYLSSGWDSTSILAALVHVFGARRVRAVIGRMQYAHRSGLINQFELERAKAVADYFGVRLDVAEFDYREVGEVWADRVRPLFLSHNLASFTGINHTVLADYAVRTTSGEEVVFAGEISDGAHNLGFSQFATILEHPVLEFREYSDKMASYLFGPTFLGLMQAGRFAGDPIYQLLRGRAPQAAFEAPAEGGPQATTQQLLASFFLRPNRLPLWSLRNSRYLTEQGAEAYSAEMEAAYLRPAAEAATPETLYAWYLHLYNSFHWQGSTVATLPLTAEAAGLEAALPFWDSRLQEFLSGMPENWGRGLDLNPTKYPLKWALKHRIDYPMHLQVGPHSYLYDVDPTFSHGAEMMYGSAFALYFKALLPARKYQAVLSPDMFDLAYLDEIVTRYAGGTEVRGAELNDLIALAMLEMVGWY